MIENFRKQLLHVVSLYRNRKDTEHVQAFLRLAIVIVLGVYFAISLDVQILNKQRDLLVVVSGAAILYAIAVIALIGFYPGVNRFRRYASMLIDFSAITYVMCLTEEYGAPLYTVLLWSIFGYGIRYGERYLLVSTLSALIGFVIVYKTTDFWGNYPTLSLGLLCSLVILPTFVYIVLQKLTRISRQAQSANRAKSRFLASMSHELRTPLNGVTSMAQLLLNTELNQEQRNIATTIDSSAKRLQGIVENILDISTLDAGEETLNRSDIDIHHVINTVVTTLSPGAEAKGLHLHVYISPEVPIHLCGDGDRLKQILFNLIGNAIKFTDEGSITVTMMLHEISDDTVHVRLSVRDTGIGISGATFSGGMIPVLSLYVIPKP